jgi:hypothetical protein
VFAAILAIDATAIAALSDFPAPATRQRPFGGREYIRRLPIAWLNTCGGWDPSAESVTNKSK